MRSGREFKTPESFVDAFGRVLGGASADPAFLHAFWLLTQIPLAARGPTFAADLRALGIKVPPDPSLMDVAAGFAGEVDRYAREKGGRTDLGEMAQMAAVESLMSTVGPDLPSLFQPAPHDVQRALGRLASGERFSVLAREFFARLTERTLAYYLSRELSNHIGFGKRFSDDTARSRFDQSLAWYCREASQIVEAFAGAWYGKHVYQGAGITPVTVGYFAPVAFKKLRDELRQGRDAYE